MDTRLSSVLTVCCKNKRRDSSVQQTDSRRPIQNPSVERTLESEYDGKCMDVSRKQLVSGTC